MNNPSDLVVSETRDVGLLHEIGSRIAAANPLHEVLERVVEFISAMVKSDSCFVYVLDGNDLVLRASKNPHAEVLDRLTLQMGQGITGWVAEHKKPVAVARGAYQDARFRAFSELPEDRYEAFLSVPVLSRGKTLGVINVQYRQPHSYTTHEIQFISTVGFLLGAEMERARLASENSQLSERLETRKVVERAKGILQRELQLSEEEAYLMLQRQSRQRRKPMREVAGALILSADIKKAKATPL